MSDTNNQDAPDASGPQIAAPTMNQAANDMAGKIFVVTGPPCSGKGTQCKALADLFGLVHISTGDIFRDHLRRNTELGAQAKEYMDNRSFVPDDLVTDLVADILKQADVKSKGCLLDGFPRTAQQAEKLKSILTVDRVFQLKAPVKALTNRAKQRRIDPSTGAIYNLKFVLPPKSNRQLMERLQKRDGDSDPQAFRCRLETHHAQMRRVLPHFQGKITRISALQPVQDITAQIIAGWAAGSAAAAAATVTFASASIAKCSVCLDADADFLVTPCGHQCGCEECLTAIKNTSGNCPICRTRIGSVQRVFSCGSNSSATATSVSQSNTPVVDTGDVEAMLDQNASLAYDEWPEEPEPEAGAESDLPSASTLPSITIAPTTDCPISCDTETQVMVSVRAPDMNTDANGAGPARVPTDVCCVIDVSGSMGVMATYENQDGAMQDDGLSILDIVKHAVTTVAHALGPDDRLALVAFNSEAQTAFELTPCSDTGRDAALAALSKLTPGGQTNIWSGILCGMDALRQSSSAAGADASRSANARNFLNAGDMGGEGIEMPPVQVRRKALMLLTDGQPNIAPPRGHLPELRDYKDQYPELQVQMNTFGFGYNLDSDLLLGLAEEGNGTYAFIPDAVILGTVFVDSIANVLTNYTQQATLHLSTPSFSSKCDTNTNSSKSRFTGSVLGDHPSTDESWGRVISLGAMQYGQSRDIVVPMHIPAGATSTSSAGGAAPYLEVVLSYTNQSCVVEKVVASGSTRKGSSAARLAKLLGDTVSVGHAVLRDALAVPARGKQAQQKMTALSKAITDAANASCADASGAGVLREWSSSAGFNGGGGDDNDDWVDVVPPIWEQTNVWAVSPTPFNNDENKDERENKDEEATTDEDEDEEAAVHSRLIALKADVAGRMTKALQGQARFKRWGAHYLRALVRSHQIQHCTNYMDAGLQLYGSNMFRELRAEGDKIFLSLPAPQPQRSPYARASATVSGSTPTSVASAATINTTYYAGSGGGCVGSEGLVTMADGTLKKAVDVQIGDLVHSPNANATNADANANATSAVTVVATWHWQHSKATHPKTKVMQLPTPTAASAASLTTALTSLWITHKHPVKVAGEWTHPRDLPSYSKTSAASEPPAKLLLCNFVLDAGHSLLVNGVECVTMGGGKLSPTYGTSVANSYYEAGVVGELKQHPQYPQVVGDLHDIMETMVAVPTPTGVVKKKVSWAQVAAKSCPEQTKPVAKRRFRQIAAAKVATADHCPNCGGWCCSPQRADAFGMDERIVNDLYWEYLHSRESQTQENQSAVGNGGIMEEDNLLRPPPPHSLDSVFEPTVSFVKPAMNVEITVVPLDGQSFTVSVTTKDSISSLKKAIAAVRGVDPKFQKLFIEDCDRPELIDTQAVHHYPEIIRGGEVFLVNTRAPRVQPIYLLF